MKTDNMKSFINSPIWIVLFTIFLFSPCTIYSQDDPVKLIEDRVKKLEEEIEKTRENLLKSEKELQEKEKAKLNILSELKKEDRKFEILNSNIQKIIKVENSLNSQMSSANKQYKTAQKSLAERQDEYTSRIRSMYKRQRVSPVGMLLSVGSISSMLRGFKMLSAVAMTDVEVINSIRIDKANIEKSIKTINASLRAQKSLASTKKREQSSLDKTRRDRRSLVAEISNDEEILKARLQQYKQDIENAQAEKNGIFKEIAKEVGKIDISEEIKQYNFAGKKGKLPWPVSGPIVSSFGIVTDQNTKTKTTNRGIEIATKNGSPVTAIASGIVMKTQFIRGYGNFVWMFHYPKYYTIYAHLSDILVNETDEIKEGQIIGLTGSTGMIDDSKSTLLLEILDGKTPMNPRIWLSPSKERAGM